MIDHRGCEEQFTGANHFKLGVGIAPCRAVVILDLARHDIAKMPIGFVEMIGANGAFLLIDEHAARHVHINQRLNRASFIGEGCLQRHLHGLWPSRPFLRRQWSYLAHKCQMIFAYRGHYKRSTISAERRSCHHARSEQGADSRHVKQREAVEEKEIGECQREIAENAGFLTVLGVEGEETALQTERLDQFRYRYFVAFLFDHQMSECDFIGLAQRRQHVRGLTVEEGVETAAHNSDRRRPLGRWRWFDRGGAAGLAAEARTNRRGTYRGRVSRQAEDARN